MLDGKCDLGADHPGRRSPATTQITGSFTQADAENLANVLKYGALPLTFEQQQAPTVSPTLGSDQLKAGLLAGGIGLGAGVPLLAALLPRARPGHDRQSLAVSAVLMYAMLVICSASTIGFTLTLAGIAGFIVAVGITADSFVVFFERLKDEVREGRTTAHRRSRGPGSGPGARSCPPTRCRSSPRRSCTTSPSAT